VSNISRQALYQRLGRGCETAALIGNGSIDGANFMGISDQQVLLTHKATYADRHIGGNW
jgi:hypothetical protein